MFGKRTERRQFSKILGKVVLISLLVLVVVSITRAQGPNSVNGPSSILDEYKGLQNGWITKLLGAAQRLLELLTAFGGIDEAPPGGRVPKGTFFSASPS